MSSERYLIRYSGAVSIFMVILVLLNLQVTQFIPSEQISIITGLSSALVVLFGAMSSGFFFSQAYWLYFTRCDEGYLGRRLRPQYRAFARKFRIDEKKRRKLETRFDYRLHQQENGRLLDYTARRWNLYHALGTISFTLILSTALSILLGISLPLLFPRLFGDIQYSSYIKGYFDTSFCVRLAIISVLSILFVTYSILQRRKLEEEVNEVEKLWVENLERKNNSKQNFVEKAS